MKLKLPKLPNIFSLFQSKLRAKIIFSVIVLLIIWLVLPLILLSGVHPFASIGVRLALTGLAIAGVAVWYGIGFIQKYKLQSWTIVKSSFDNVGQKFHTIGQSGFRYSKEYYSDLHDKFHSDRKRRRLKRLPWYLVLGSSESGKSTFIQQSGLYFQRPEHLGEEVLNYINEYPDFDWWFTQQAILVDAMSQDQEEDVTRWKKFIKLLKRERRNRPFNGVVITMSLSDLLLLSNKQRQDLIQRYTHYLRSNLYYL
jgi:type VI secretion system protein ImpL